MFDLEAIKRDWENNCYKLSEQDIIDIYRSENVTQRKYQEEIEEHNRKYRWNVSSEERLLNAIFGNINQTEEENRKKAYLENYPQKRRLSKEMQNKVVTGCLDIVFDETNFWYKYFLGFVSIENLYYVCLEALINCVKYTLHCEKQVFGKYIIESIKRNIIKYIAKLAHTSYREIYALMNELDDREENAKKIIKLFKPDFTEIPTKPSKIYYMTKDASYDVDYLKHISSTQFLLDYQQSLEELDDTSRIVMQLSYDKEGYRGFSNREIGEYIGAKDKKVSRIRSRAIRQLQKNEKLQNYK